MSVNGATTHQSYDPADQVVGWSYDAAGNLLSDGVNSYSYDALDRLTSLNATLQTRAYGYNGDGTLITETANGAPITLTQDLAVPLSQVLQTATPGVPTADYFYGGDRYGSTRLAVAYSTLPTAHSWYVGDLDGSTRYTQNDAGAPNTSVTYYDPFGQVEGGVTPPLFGYQGEMQDSKTGLVNLRAREYNPASAQFLSLDPR